MSEKQFYFSRHAGETGSFSTREEIGNKKLSKRWRFPLDKTLSVQKASLDMLTPVTITIR
jgi:hypothetical protein